MTGMIKLDRADLVVRTRLELSNDQPRYAISSSVNGHAQPQVIIRRELQPNCAPRPL